MLSYVAKSLWRNPRRALAAVCGVALATALFADAAFFVDGSGRRMTSRAIAHVTIDMQAGVNEPLASSLHLAATMTPRPPVKIGTPVTVTLVATNTASVDAHGVVVEASAPPQLAYRPGSTRHDGVPVADVGPSEDVPAASSALGAGLPIGTLAPGAHTTLTYTATAVRPIASAADVLESSVRSADEPAPAPANGPSAVDLERLATTLRRVPRVRAAQPFALVDLPAGTVQVDGRPFDAPVKLVALDPAYPRDLPLVGFPGSAYRPGTAFLSPALAEQLGARAGSALALRLPGRPPTLPLVQPVAAVADLSRADQLFASREEGSLGDPVAAPYVVGVDVTTFERDVLPALRADDAGPSPAVKTPPVLEVHVQVAHGALDRDPGSAFVAASGVRRSVEQAAPGDVTVIDNLSANLDRARTDSSLAKVLFLGLGLPGAVLAGYLAFYGGGLLAETERRERALLRARGFPALTIARSLAYQAIAIAGLGAALGIGVALAVARGLFPAEFSPRGGGFVVSIVLAVAVSTLTTVLAVYLPARRALLRDVTEGRRLVATSDRPGWLRARLDLVLLLVAAVVTVVFVVTGGFRPNPKAHDESIARSFYVLLAPWCLWLGGTFLATRLFLAVCDRLARPAPGVDFKDGLVRRTLARSVTRRPRAVVSGIVALSLAVAFGVSLGIFVETYRHEQHADARFVTGSDVRVTPNLGAALPADVDRRLDVPGVRAISPVARVPGVVVGTEGLLFAAIDPHTFSRVAPLDRGFFTDTTPRAAMAALASDPRAVLVDKETAESFNLHKGDTLKAQLPSPTLGRPALATFHVAGTVIQFPAFPLGLDLVGNLSTYEQATGTTAPSFFLLRTNGDTHTNATVARTVRSRLGTDVPARIDTTARTANKDQTSLAGLSLTGLGRVESLYTLLIAGLAIVMFVVALLVQRNSERAVMRALGLARRRLHTLILGEATIVVGVGIVVGLAIGIPMAFMFVQILRRIFVVPPSSLTFPTSTAVLLAAVLVVSLGVSAAVIAGALRRMRLVELLRQE